GDEVAEAVDVDHLAMERGPTADGLGQRQAHEVRAPGSQVVGVRPGGERRRHWGEHVAAVEGGAARREEEALLRQLDDAPYRAWRGREGGGPGVRAGQPRRLPP